MWIKTDLKLNWYTNKFRYSTYNINSHWLTFYPIHTIKFFEINVKNN